MSPPDIANLFSYALDKNKKTDQGKNQKISLQHQFVIINKTTTSSRKIRTLNT